MTTSGISTLDPVRNELVLGALGLVGAYTSIKQPRPEQVSGAIDALNQMLKSWQIQNGLWLRQFVTVTLVASQATYSLPGATGSTFRPTQVFGAKRKDSSGNEAPLTKLSRSDYFDKPNKTSTGTPVEYYFDPQLTTATLYLWPVPVDTTYSVVLDVDRPIYIMTDAQNTYDIPQEWQEAVKYGLATRLAPLYGMNLAERQQLNVEFSRLLDNLLWYNTDHVSTYFQPGE